MKSLNLRQVSAVTLIGAAFVIGAGCTSASNARAQDEGAAKEAMAVSYEALGVPSGSYDMDKTHGYVTFSYTHLGFSNPKLRFRDIDASIEFDTDHPENSAVAVTIQAGSIDSGVDVFDEHLNSDDWFDTKAFPEISFKSTGFTRADATSGTMAGDLTIKDVTKSVTFDVDLLKAAPHPFSKTPTLGLEGRANVLRSDFGIGGYAPNVSDEVAIVISAEFNKTE